MQKTTELLAPAGSMEALRAAVQSGADAVYLGGPAFGARHAAKNFSFQEMKQGIDYCHLYGVDVHVAVNTLIKEKETEKLYNYVRALNDMGADALIVQDLGAAGIIRGNFPDMKLHASTQMTVTSLEGVKFLEEKGFSRVVLARELNAGEIEKIIRGAKAEIEVFVHGAICMCYSGQCLMSSVLGGRSGNRGRCAQPCRLPYSLTENGKKICGGYLLSPKDMALINDLKLLKEMGAASLKIEGRLKRAEYVSAVTGIYRKYLDDPRPVSDEDKKELLDAFSRSGFTDGYLKNKLGASMMSYNDPGSGKNSFTEEAKARAAENANIRKIPVKISGTLKTNKPFSVTMQDGNGNTVTVKGTQKSETALNRAMDRERIEEQLLKLGQTPFEAHEAEVYCDEGITVPIKEINDTRRKAVHTLISERQKREKGKCIPYKKSQNKEREYQTPILTAQVTSIEQAKAAVLGGIKRIYAEADIAWEIKKKFADTEVITRTSDIFMKENVKTQAVLVSSPSAAVFYKDKKLIGDMRLNVFNSKTIDCLPKMETVTLSPELNIGEIRGLLEHTDASVELIAYGRLPLMIMKNCPIRAAGKCQKGKRIYSLLDRKNEKFPILCTKGCNALLLNSKPLYMADKIEDLTKLKINSIRLIFTVENFSQCGKIIEEYTKALEGETVAKPAEGSFTRGHYYRGVE